MWNSPGGRHRGLPRRRSVSRSAGSSTVDRAVGADERDGVQVADQAVLGDGQVAPRGARTPPDTTPSLGSARVSRATVEAEDPPFAVVDTATLVTCLGAPGRVCLSMPRSRAARARAV